jgi:ABC-2 type transport system permease protein
MSGLRLYFRYLGISLRAQMEYRTSFVIRSIAHFLTTGLEFLGLAALFDRFGHIRGWTLPQMGLFYGIISIAFAIAEAVPRGFDVLAPLLRSGDFDRLLVRPRSVALQVLGLEMQLLRVGRFTQALLVLFWSASQLQVPLSPSTALLLAFAIAGGACLFSGLFVLQATLCFWTTESIEVVNCTTYGGVEAAQFPLTIYKPWFRAFFTFVIPLATVNYFPAQVLLGLDDPLGSTRLLQWLSPLAGVLFLWICLRFWRFGVRHYTSTGS